MLNRGGRWTWTVVACLTLSGCAGPKPASRYQVAVIPKGLTHEFWQSIHRGAERAAADLTAQGGSVQVLWDGPLKESDALEQINIVDRNVGRRVSGIVLAPQHSKTMVAPVERAVQQGIPVVIIDSGLESPDLYVKYVATNNYNGGRLAAQRLLDVLGKQGKPTPRIVLFRYQVGSESTEQREKGFEDVINARIEEQKKAGQPTITWLSNDKYAGATVDSAEREAGPLVSRLRDQGIDGIFAPNESSATGMLNVLRSQGLDDKVTLVGFDSSEPLLQAVAEGDVDGLIVQDPYRMGYLGVWTLVQHLQGYDVSAGGKEQSTGEYLLTRENLHDNETRQRFDSELQKQRTISTPTYQKRK
jgi:ribose transport system substrate-binding protein